MALPRWDPKDPNDIADYWFDFGSTDLLENDRFLPDGVTITAATVSIADEIDQPTPVAPFDFLEIVSQGVVTPKVRVRLAGGMAASYPVTCLITTSTTEQFEITKTLIVKERTK